MKATLSLPYRATYADYLAVEQGSERRHEFKVHRRTERGEWCTEPEVYRQGDSFELPNLTRPVAVDDVYEDVLDADGHSLLR